MTTRPSSSRDNIPQAGARVEAHTHRTRYLAGDPQCISVRPTTPGTLTSYVAYLVLDQVTFAVQPAGHRRCLDEGVRNVHAWVRGTVEEALDATFADVMLPPGVVKVAYQPFLAAHFFIPGYADDGSLLVGNKVTGASRVWLYGKDLYALDPVLSAPEPLTAKTTATKKKAA